MTEIAHRCGTCGFNLPTDWPLTRTIPVIDAKAVTGGRVVMRQVPVCVPCVRKDQESKPRPGMMISR